MVDSNSTTYTCKTTHLSSFTIILYSVLFSAFHAYFLLGSHESRSGILRFTRSIPALLNGFLYFGFLLTSL